MGDVLSQEEIDALLRGQEEVEAEEEVQASPVSPLPQETEGSVSKGGSSLNQRKLELILGVPVRNRVVIGKVTRMLKDLLDLKPGMIIETENSVSDLAELQVNGKTIALGEVVVVGEYYGLRIKRIITPEERIRRLK